MFAALEWVIPRLIATYIFKPYFESFLKEEEKDHYQILKKKMNALLTKAKGMHVRKVTASECTEKLDKTNTQTGAISIFLETKQGYLIKLLYDNNLDLSVCEQATNQMSDLIEMHYENNNDPISKYLNQISEQKIGKKNFRNN